MSMSICKQGDNMKKLTLKRTSVTTEYLKNVQGLVSVQFKKYTIVITYKVG